MRFTAKSTLERVADALMNQIMFKIGGGDGDEGLSPRTINRSQSIGMLSLERSFKAGRSSLQDNKAGKLMKQVSIQKIKVMDAKGEEGSGGHMAFLNSISQKKGPGASNKDFHNTFGDTFHNAKNPKDLCKDLHNKTHFKAAMTLQLQSPILKSTFNAKHDSAS